MALVSLNSQIHQIPNQTQLCGFFGNLVLTRYSRLLDHDSRKVWVEISANQWD